MRIDLMGKLKIQLDGISIAAHQSIENDFEFFYQNPFLSSHSKQQINSKP